MVWVTSATEKALLTFALKTGSPDTESVWRSFFYSCRFQPEVMGEVKSGPPEERVSLAKHLWGEKNHLLHLSDKPLLLGLTFLNSSPMPAGQPLTAGPRVPVPGIVPAAEASFPCRMGLSGLTGTGCNSTTHAHLSNRPDGTGFCAFYPVLPPMTRSMKAHTCSQNTGVPFDPSVPAHPPL